MTALLFKNWGFPHKVFKGVQTFESKKIKETLQIQRFSHFLILPQTGIEPVREYKSRRILSPVRLPVPPLRHTRQIAPTPLESCASMRSIASHYVITLLANHDNLLSRNGTNRARTYDPLLVRQMLSQLSYDPICSSVLQPTSLLYNYLLLNVNYFFHFFVLFLPFFIRYH